MAEFLWACWDGGGNLTPSLGIARALERRGHRVVFHGRPDMISRVESAGLEAHPLATSYLHVDRYAFHPMPTVFGFTSSPAVADELVEVVQRSTADAVVIDAMFSAALQVASRFERPTGVMVHTFLHRIFDGWSANFEMQSASRQRAGFDPLDPLDVLWGERDLVHVNTLAAFDGTPVPAWSNVVHGAPVLAAERRAVPLDLPWPDDDPRPIVLLSFSTVPEQRDVDALQRALDALAPLPVLVVATTGDVVEPDELIVPANTRVVRFADHDALMRRASLVVGHGGHGTTMRALRHGLPIVGMPARGADQVPITRLLEEWHVGRALPGNAGVDQIRDAVTSVLADRSIAGEARRRGELLASCDGAALAADSLERLVGRTPQPLA
ncbi:MAG: glycosyltransferase [Acidimicrobiales bacterium]